MTSLDLNKMEVLKKSKTLEEQIEDLKEENKSEKEILEFILDNISTESELNLFICMISLLKLDDQVINELISKARAKINNKFSTLKSEDITERMTEENKKIENSENTNIESNTHKYK